MIGLLPPGGLLEILIADDVVALEDAPGLMPGKAHGHPLRATGLHHVANRCSPEIVKETALEPNFPAGSIPAPPKILDLPSLPLKYVGTS